MEGARPLVIAADVGGTRIRAALSDMEGHILRRQEWPTETERGRDGVLDRIVELIQQVRGDTPASDVRGVGVGTPGPLDPRQGMVLSAPNLPGWYNLPLQSILQERLGLPVQLINDANAAALGEWVFGAGRGCQNLVYVTISTGIGGGVITDGRLLLGHRGLAGEVGHMTLEAGGPRCNCGNYGCWEVLAAGPAIGREGAEAVRDGLSPVLAELSAGQPHRVDARMVGEAAHRGDPRAKEIIARSAYYCGVGMVNLLHLYSPEIILVGGGVSKLGDLIYGPMRQVVQERAMPAYRGVPIKPASLGEDMGLLGAVALFKEEK